MRNTVRVLSVQCVLVLCITAVAAVGEAQNGNSLCGHVLTVSCLGPSNPVNLLLEVEADSQPWEIVIPSEHRPTFGPSIEHRYEDHAVCVALDGVSPDRDHRLVVRDPSLIVLQNPADSSREAPDRILRSCDPEVSPAMVVRELKPQYTIEAIRRKVQGTLILRGTVNQRGVVRDIHVVRSIEPSLDAEAQKAFALWQYLPATRRGEAVEMVVSVEMRFTLR